MDQQKIGSFLKSLRKEKGITQEKLAEELGVSGRTVSRWETGNNMPDISVLIEISEFYDVSIPEIVDGERKSENMDDESKKVAESLSDYADADKTKTIKEIRQLSLVGVAALAIYFIIDVSGYAGAYDIADRISAYSPVKICPEGAITVTPVYTWCVLPESKRSIRTASSSSFGFPSDWPQNETSVSAPRMKQSG